MEGHEAQSGPVAGISPWRSSHAVLPQGIAARPSLLALGCLARALYCRGRALAERKPMLARPPAPSEPALAVHVRHVELSDRRQSLGRREPCVAQFGVRSRSDRRHLGGLRCPASQRLQCVSTTSLLHLEGSDRPPGVVHERDPHRSDPLDERQASNTSRFLSIRRRRVGRIASALRPGVVILEHLPRQFDEINARQATSYQAETTNQTRPPGPSACPTCPSTAISGHPSTWRVDRLRGHRGS